MAHQVHFKSYTTTRYQIKEAGLVLLVRFQSWTSSHKVFYITFNLETYLNFFKFSFERLISIICF